MVLNISLIISSNIQKNKHICQWFKTLKLDYEILLSEKPLEFRLVSLNSTKLSIKIRKKFESL